MLFLSFLTALNVESGILAHISNKYRQCYQECIQEASCSHYEYSKEERLCKLYAYVHSYKARNRYVLKSIRNRMNRIPQFKNFTISFLKMPQFSNYPFYSTNNEYYSIKECALGCLKSIECIAFSAQPLNLLSCQYLQMIKTNSSIPFNATAPQFIYIKDTIASKVSESELINDPLPVGAILGICGAGFMLLVTLLLIFYKRYWKSTKYQPANTSINVDYDPQHDILLQDKETLSEATLQKEYIPNLTVLQIK